MNDLAAKLSRSKPACMLCGPESKVSLRFVKRGYNIYRCAGCGLMFVFPQPDFNELLKLYDTSYFKRGSKYLAGEETEAHTHNLSNDTRKIQMVKKYRGTGKLLDVGCAMGGFLSLARQEGFEVEGVEVSGFCAKYVKEKLGIEVHNGGLASAHLPSNTYDILTMWDVIEHLQDPGKTLSEAGRILRPGGLLYITTGDIGSLYARVMARLWHLLTPPQHLFYFTRNSLLKSLNQSEFVVKEFLYPGKQVTLDFILFKARETFGPLVKLFQVLAKTLKIGTLKIYVNIYDIMTCIAQKK